MRLRTGHRPDDWRDLGASVARIQGHAGSLVTPLPDAREMERVKRNASVLTANQRGETKQ